MVVVVVSVVAPVVLDPIELEPLADGLPAVEPVVLLPEPEPVDGVVVVVVVLPPAPMVEPDAEPVPLVVASVVLGVLAVDGVVALLELGDVVVVVEELPAPMVPVLPADEPEAALGVPVALIGAPWLLVWPAPVAGSAAVGFGGVLCAMATLAMATVAALASRPLRSLDVCISEDSLVESMKRRRVFRQLRPA